MRNQRRRQRQGSRRPHAPPSRLPPVASNIERTNETIQYLWATRATRRRYLMIMRAQRSRQVVRKNSAYGTSTVRSPGASGWGQICSTSASGIVVAVTAIVPAVISATSDGSSAR
jgi:hypothetical protein